MSIEILYGFETREAFNLLTSFEINEDLVPSVFEIVDN